MKSPIAALSFLMAFFCDSAQAQDDETFVKGWMAHQMVVTFSMAPFDLATAQDRMRGIYASLIDQSTSIARGTPSVRAQTIARFLDKDLDNDGVVTTSELKEILSLRAAMPLTAAAGVRVDPTPEQVGVILQTLLAKELEADKNTDGNIDFAEMRQYARDQISRTFGIEAPISLRDAAVLHVLDTSGDKKISEAEFLEGTRRFFAVIDANKDGKVTREEALVHIPKRYRTNTF